MSKKSFKTRAIIDHLDGIDVTAAHNELMKIHTVYNKITPELVVKAASDNTNPLHKCFTWDNDAAAHKWRLTQARSLIKVIVTELPTQGNEKFRAFVSVRSGKKFEYQPLDVVVNDKMTREMIDAKFKQDIDNITSQYRIYKHLKKYCDQLEKLNQTISI